MNNDDNVFEYLSNDNIIPIDRDIKEEEDKEEKANQFVSGLPQWDLEPPYEIIRRRQS